MTSYNDSHIYRLWEHESIGRYSSHLFRSIQIYLAKELGPYGIGSGQFPFMMLLLHCDGIKQEELASSLSYDRATITRSMNRLEEIGYVTRERDPDDKRAYIVRLTKKGRSMENVFMEISSRLNDLLMSGFTEAEAASFISMLMRAGENISAENNIRKLSK